VRVIFTPESCYRRGPGFHEDKQGRPFVGPAGQFLDELLSSIHLRRSDVFITNVVKCRPPNNRDPLPEEIEACDDYLDRQIDALKPNVIVTLGRYSASKFFATRRSGHSRQSSQKGAYMCIAMYHPAAGLHQAGLKDVIRDDFKKIPLIIAEADRLAAEAPSSQSQPDQSQESHRAIVLVLT